MNNIPHIIDTGASPKKMNAYELADNLDKFGSQDPYPLLFTKSADMLRQQADRIAKLEKSSEPIAWVYFDLEGAPVKFDYQWGCKMQKLNAKVPLYATPQTKPLSDEQIFKLAEKLELKVSHALYAFARTLIREAQEK